MESCHVKGVPVQASETLDDGKNLVKYFYSEMNNDLDRKFGRNFFERAHLGINLKGGLFEHLKFQAKEFVKWE